MTVLLPVHNRWTNKIFSGEKIFEFRKKLPKLLSPEDKILFYETVKNGGAGAVVGEAIVSNIIKLTSDDGEFPMFGAYPFVDRYCTDVLHDTCLAQKFAEAKALTPIMKDYKHGFIVSYANEWDLKAMRETGELYRPTRRDFSDDGAYHKAFRQTLKILENCDEWLKNMGYYNEFDGVSWEYAIGLEDVRRYPDSIPLSSFSNREGKPITKAPQSFIYLNC